MISFLFLKCSELIAVKSIVFSMIYLELLNTNPILKFKYSCKFDKTDQITEGEYFNFDIEIINKN